MGGFLCARHLVPAARKSIHEIPNTTVRKSVRVDNFGASASALIRADEDDEGGCGSIRESQYNSVIAESKTLVGHGGAEGTFPEEWDAQLLVDCGRSAQGDRVVIFCPSFLKCHLGDSDELDRAFRFLLLSMDQIAMREKYVFIYCFGGMDWAAPELTSRLRLAYDILPEKYPKNLRRLYMLHATQSFRFTMWTFWSWLTQRTWEKIEYMGSLDSLCELLQPEDAAARQELRRRFPQVVQRNDATIHGENPPVTFGVPLRQLCSSFGVDFTDKTTGRWYPRLPPALVFLCETMEREAAEEHFGDMFSADAAMVYDTVERVDSGEPLLPDTPTAVLWCVLKLYLDCLPCPLLSYSAMDELLQRDIREDDAEGKRRFLVWLFQHKVTDEAAYVALYTASFLRIMCQNAQDKEIITLNPALAATLFASCFFRPRDLSQEHLEGMSLATAVVETLIEGAEEPDLWGGRSSSAPRWDKVGVHSDSSTDEA